MWLLKTLLACIPFLFLYKAFAQSNYTGGACVVSSKTSFAKYSPVQLTGKKKGPLFEVEDMDRKKTWVNRRDISFSRRCIAVTVGKSRLRTGPGSDYALVVTVQRGDAFLDLGGEDGWTRVQNSRGEKAWLNLDHGWSPASRKMRMSFDVE